MFLPLLSYPVILYGTYSSDRWFVLLMYVNSNNHIQDVLLVSYLANTIRTQIDLSNRLATATLTMGGGGGDGPGATGSEQKPRRDGQQQTRTGGGGGQRREPREPREP